MIDGDTGHDDVGIKIPTPESLNWADMEEGIEDVSRVLMIKTIHVKYYLNATEDKFDDYIKRVLFESYQTLPCRPEWYLLYQDWGPIVL